MDDTGGKFGGGTFDRGQVEKIKNNLDNINDSATALEATRIVLGHAKSVGVTPAQVSPLVNEAFGLGGGFQGATSAR